MVPAPPVRFLSLPIPAAAGATVALGPRIYRIHALVMRSNQGNVRPPHGRNLAKFRGLYERYGKQVYAFFANRGFAVDDCRDLVQETFFRAFKASGSFREESQVATWLLSIAKNVFREEMRNRSRLKRAGTTLSLEALQVDSGFDQPAPASEPLGELLASEETALLQAALGDLPEAMRSCVQLRLVQGLRYREIAEVLQISVGTVKSQLSEARRRLKGKLKPSYSADL
ncbi:MAG: sigma-70 family RNA polymerase sigma factor [Acidobacteriota bacterium]